MNEVVLGKKASIERCIVQIREYYRIESGRPFHQDFMRQDAIIMNLQRLCARGVDIANHWVMKAKLGLPRTSAESFELLQTAGLIDSPMCDQLKNLIGACDTLARECIAPDLRVMVDIIRHHLEDPLAFADLALERVV
jgi:uncharacterized protein YutE (UPF0331/DUF86 family)